MKKILFPSREQWPPLLLRPVQDPFTLESVVREIFEAVQTRGDEAVREYASRFDRGNRSVFQLSEEEIRAGADRVPQTLREAIDLAADNIRKFHRTQAEAVRQTETTPGVVCWRESRPIDTVGIYIPGGSAPLFSTLLMLGIPAVLAGCERIVLCSPPNAEGKLDPAILYAARKVGITTLFALGGVQAIAAMALGTPSVPRVHKIFGPGNQYVTAAKQLAQQYGTAIDMPAGPSEVLVIADDSCHPGFVAADLLSQAEHGEDSQVVLLSPDPAVLDAVLAELAVQLETLPRKETARKALDNSLALALENLDACMEFSNRYAPEHLILATDQAEALASSVRNAGSVFLGNYSCESAGDYASGTNHTLPTNGFARSYSGVSLDSFVKKITFQKLSADGIRNIGPAIEQMATAEQLEAHKRAVSIRLAALASPSNPISPA